MIKMGYTHYWDISKDVKEISKECLKDIKKVLQKHKGIIQFESDNTKKPIVNKKEIRFNGIGGDGYETFNVLMPDALKKEGKRCDEGLYFNFCKTAKQPYDVVVCEVLLLLKADLKDKIKVSSDGFSHDSCSFDGSWDKAIYEITNMKYHVNCCCQSRAVSPYYDCEIIEVVRVKGDD